MQRRLRKKWEPDEDQKLRLLVEQTRRDIPGFWSEISKGMGGRDPRQCRERWTYHLSDAGSSEQREWTDKQDKVIIMAVIKYNHQYEEIVRAGFPTLKGLNALAIKNRWQCLRKRIDCHDDYLRLGRPGRRGRKPKQNLNDAYVLPPPVQVPEVPEVPQDNTGNVNQQEMFKPFSMR